MSRIPAKIAVLLPRFSRYGGVEQFGYRLSEKLAARGHSVDFICARQEAEPPAGVTVLRTGRPRGPRWLKMLVFALRGEALRKKGRYDCTVSLGKTLNQDITRIGGGPLQAFWRLSDQAWAPGFPRFWKQITRRLQPANWLTILMEKRMLTQTACIVAISDAVREWIVEVYPHLARSGGGQTLLTIFNDHDTSRFREPTPQEKDKARRILVPDGNPYIVGVATTNFALKGVGQLITALTLLPEDIHLCVAGGRNPERYLAQAATEGVASRVRFLGRVDDMKMFYHGLDLFILPTFYDTFGNVVPEALACGLKVICSDRAGAAAFLPENRILRHPESPEAIADIIRETRADMKACPVHLPQNRGIDAFVALVETTLAQNARKADQY